MAYEKLNKPYIWVDAEDAKITLLDAEKLNEKEKTLNDIDDRLVDVGNALEELKSKTSEAAEDLSTAISDVEKKVSKVEDKAGENYELIYSLREEVREDIENLQEADAEIKKSIASISTDLALTSSPKAPAITEKVIGNPVCVKDTADGYANVKVRGKYEQDSITGAQLLDLTTALRNSNASATYNEPALTVVKNFAISSAKVVYKIAEVEKLTGQTIYLKCGYTGNGGKVELGYCNDTASSASTPATLEVGEGETAELSLEVSQPTDTSKIYVYAAFYPDTSKAGSKGDVGVFTDVMVSTSAAATWEPYTGGVAVPNPNYPQEIKKSVIGKVKTHGSQLIDIPDFELVKPDTRVKTFIFNSVIAAGTYHINIELGGTATRVAVKSQYFDGTTISKDSDYVLLSNGDNVLVSSYDFDRLYFYIEQSQANGVTASFKNVMFSVEAAEYEPYTESVATLSTPIELGGLNGIKDTMDAEKIVRRFIEVVFDGSDDEGWTASSAVSGRYITKNYTQITPMSRGLCTHALFGGDNNAELNKFYISSSSQFIINTSFATLSEWKAHLAANPMTAVLSLAEPTTEELPTADQIALNGLKSFDGVTYVETDSEVKPTLDVECVLDTKRYIDRKIAEVAAAIIG